ncbi:MAG: glycoside hydrolase family 3 C-terminal domain-containing protein, partial [Oscillospiraceae bacterium]|nr:glycoside hydrolase family 3 C-terminal domain-containing protein [Oscillospiraceae bacterium]
MKKHVWKALSLVTIFLLIVCLVGTNIATTYESMLNQALNIEISRVEGGSGQAAYYVSDYANLEEMYQAKIQLLRDIADEGVVLLKNDGALPLRSGKIAMLGEENFYYSTSSGGGSVTEEIRARTTSLTDALSQDGLTVVDAPAGCDMALVVIGRAAGEGKDMAQGGLALTSDDQANIDAAKASGAKVVVLLSGDHPIETAQLERDAGVSAILHLGNAGFRGAYGVADVITGTVTPSGKLVDTYAADTMSSPAMMNFGDYAYTNSSRIKASQAKNYVVYAEGIYSDYRYYETRYEDCVLGQGSAASGAGVYAGSGSWSYADEVAYPFGYGLSYTTFSKELVGEPVFDHDAHTAVLTVKVTNTGSVAGKEVVTVFAQSPYTDYDIQNKVEKASVQLLGFEKTGELAPSDSETLEVTVHLQWLASYDYVTAKTYIMDAGDYYFSVGGSAHDALNNILAAKGKTTADGMTEDGDAALTYHWVEDSLDTTTYA